MAKRDNQKLLEDLEQRTDDIERRTGDDIFELKKNVTVMVEAIEPDFKINDSAGDEREAEPELDLDEEQKPVNDVSEMPLKDWTAFQLTR